jgi:hypothetical protein
MRKYTFSYNYEEPYGFVVESNKITMIHNNKKVLSREYDAVMVGKSPKNKMTQFSGGHGAKYNGNTLLGIKGSTVSYLSNQIYNFKLRNGEQIIAYMSPVGNNMVPYPYVITDKHIYFLLEKKYMKLEDIGTLLKKSYKDDPYGEYLYNDEFKDKAMPMKVSGLKKLPRVYNASMS